MVLLRVNGNNVNNYGVDCIVLVSMNTLQCVYGYLWVN